MTKVQKLELTWIGRDQWSRLEPRNLLENPKQFDVAIREQD